MKKINLKEKDEIAETYNKIEKAIPHSKVIEIQAKYSDWFYLEDSEGNDLLVRTMFRINKNIVQLIAIKLFVVSYKDNTEYMIFEYDIPQKETHWNFDLWTNEDARERKVKKEYFAESDMNVDQLLLFASKQMEERGK